LVSIPFNFSVSVISKRTFFIFQSYSDSFLFKQIFTLSFCSSSKNCFYLGFLLEIKISTMPGSSILETGLNLYETFPKLNIRLSPIISPRHFSGSDNS
jgi:hypothetical protein